MLRVQNLFFNYSKKMDLFNDLCLELKPGNIYGLLGKNGAGKTTLLKLISGLLYPKKGQCSYNDFNVRDRKTSFLEDMYFLPEGISLPDMKVDLFEKLNAPFYGKFNKEQFQKYLEEFEVGYNSHLNALSMGQKKKFAIAFALAANTSLLLLDEPTNGLDIPSKGIFRKIIASKLTEEKTIIISTHQVRDMKNIIDSIIILDEGKILFKELLYKVGEKLKIIFYPEKPAAENIIYCENTLGGYAVLEENKDNVPNDVDIEILFNAVTSNKEFIKKYFNGVE